MQTDTTTAATVILGGGYAGVMAANRLAGRGQDTVLLTPDPRFTERIRLHEFTAGGRADPTQDYRSLLHPAVRLVAGAAAAIEPSARTVHLASGDSMGYEYLVYAVGSGSAPAPAGAVAPDRLDGAREARRRLRELARGERIAVVGGGLTAVEMAAEIARQYPDNPLTLYASGTLVPQLAESTRSGMLESLRRAGVEVHAGTVDPENLPEASLVLWCAGFGVPSLAARSGLPVNADGRLVVDSSLRVPGQDRIFGAGDAAVIGAPGYGYLPMTCATAMPMGAEAASNILRLQEGEPLPRHDSGFQAQCISLGRRDGAVQFLTPGFTPRRLHVHGRSAAVLKEVICRMTLRWIRGEARKSGAYTWPRGPKLNPQPVPRAAWA
ncbi:NAD(P)/FAD-dependent oxidoreductase [Arthrobacter caoxuetaonis]|uniref:FAD-dependent oxidoreductase n=1 Tax=Arthrobacter caoxuetaonis TaxID=2886935 RepID=A0A9X1MGV0_9MICC|nr:FAD-dependent oxidoreductase [Arthrobacter caoxuetaonis]MCC3283813.1 FAD-dependent oxidoreductase [Arthrobacter caoxuetaonis]MCC3299045.1 FAD-dependent oxidoreductase [Arthrobacter caoxuetaonis]USQ58616.1 FAD-dependent oxidoreductase [Arthrobacter caoxuetaonis]